MTQIKPNSYEQNYNPKLRKVFLAGSIEQGKAEPWQKKCEEVLKLKFNTFNPRREHWDADLDEEIQNKVFHDQVDWELDHLEDADIILMNFDPQTKSPISLLELGLFARTGKLIVVCPEGFWRKGNVDIVCERFNIPQHQNLNKALEFLMSETS